MKTKRPRYVVLASASPRRRDLLRYNFNLKILPAHCDESVLRGESAQRYVTRVAHAKWSGVRAKLSRSKPTLLLSADTTVCVGKNILGKPQSKSDCRRMIRLLSGKTHFVITAVCVGWSDERRPQCFVSKSAIKFRRISDSELTRYVKAGDWRDKAGAYAIQGQGLDFVEYFRGSFTNIVGLPVIETFQALEKRFSQRRQ